MSDESAFPAEDSSQSQQSDQGALPSSQHNQEGAVSPPPSPVVGTNWAEPRGVLLLLPPTKRLDADLLLPAPFLPYCRHLSTDLQIRIDAPAVAVMGSYSGAVMRRAAIKPKLHSNWTVHPIFWTILVQASGAMKSPCLNAALRPLEELQEEAIREYLREKVRYAAERAENPEGQGPEPTCPRYITNESTFAALQQLLVDNPFGLLMARDELPGFLNTFTMKDRQADKQFFLESWPGTRGFTVDRIGRGTIHASKVAVAILGGIQPALMQRVVTAAVERGDFADGFLPRFQLAVWPDESPEYSYIDEPVDPEVYQRVLAVFRRAIEMGVDEPRQYRFDPDAQARFEQYLEHLEGRIRRGISDNIMKEHLSKYRSLMPAMALLIHVAEDPDANEIPLHRARRAELWTEYLESHARRVYACVIGGQRLPVQILADRLRAGALGTRFTVRQVYGHDWSGLTTPDAVRASLMELQEAGWVREVQSTPGPQGGRPSEVFEVNPKIYRP
jgi:putative DNA primase/helicase